MNEEGPEDMTRELERKEQVSGENSQSLVRVRIIDFTQFYLTWPAAGLTETDSRAYFLK